MSGEFVCCECGKKRKARKIDRFLGSIRYFIPTTVGDGALDVPKNRNSKPTAFLRQSACVAFCILNSYAYLTFDCSRNFCLRYVKFAILHCFVNGSRNNLVLLLFREFVEIDGVTADSYRELRIFLGVLLRV